MGQDSRRGTFSHRHAALIDYENGAQYVPLANLDATAFFTVRDSFLSEYAALGFDYGYSVEATNTLVAWEAQFGDFVNGAEIIIDNFLVAAEDKWGQHASLVMLLPHGYEGQGPEHSSGRIERFLSLCARNNIRVAQPTTAAQYFHLLRSQVLRENITPLIIFTPKSMLRAVQTRSKLEEFESGSFQTVLDDSIKDRAAVLGWCSPQARLPTRRSLGETRSARRGRRARGAALPVAHRTHRRGLDVLSPRRRSRLATRRTREHGRVAFRALADAPPTS